MIAADAIVGIETGAALRANPFAQTTAPARRVGLVADDDRISADLTTDYLKLIDAAVNWASGGAANRTIGFVTGDGVLGDDDFDTFWSDRLTAQGHTVISIDDGDLPNVAAPNAHMFIISNDVGSDTVAAGGKYTNLAKAVINYEAGAQDELGISSAGTNTTALSSVQIVAPAHPLAAGLTGTIEISNPPQGAFQLLGTERAPGGTIVATIQVTGTGQIDTLAEADALKAGTIPSNMFTGPISQADIWDSDATGRWTFDNIPVGSPGVADDFAVFNTGTLNVTQAGTYHFAITGDDGGRLRIDKNGDMVLNDADNVIVDNTLHGVEDRFGSLQLNPGTYKFEWVGFERGGGASWEFSAAVNPAPIADPFTGESGSYFAGADIDDGFAGGATEANPRKITTRAISVAGAQNLQVSVDIAASPPGPWDPTDILRILVDPDASGPAAPIQLKEFRGDQPDRSLSNGADILNDMFRNFTFPLTGVIPAGAQQISLIVESFTTAGDERVGIENLRLLGTLPGLVGDYSGNGVVDAADYVLWRNNLGGNASSFAAGSRDPANTGPIGQGDYTSWRANFGKTLGLGGAGAVPEPMTTWLILSGLSWLLLTTRWSASPARRFSS
jgi:hypothetical protein